MQFWTVSAAGMLSCMALLAGCAKESPSGAATKGAGQGPPVPVMVAPVVQRDVPVELRTFGYVEANLTVTVRAQITGTLMAVHFKEGQNVKKGDELFSIDPRPFEAAIKQAEANVARDKATQENAVKEALRQKELLAKGITSQGDYDAAQTTSNALLATIRSGEAAVDRAKIDLGYCSIRSPIDGRVGAWLVDQGNLVMANSSTLVTINQVRPIQASFSLVEEALVDVQKESAGRKLQVLALIPGRELEPEKGELSFIDNTVDRTTGKFTVKAMYPNTDERLWPGLFVNVVVVLRQQPGAIIIPSRAIQPGQKGTFVFVVKPDQTVEDRLITIDRPIDGETVISKGLSAGETVVIDGQLRLVPGAKVAVKTGLNVASPAAGKAPAPAAEAKPSESSESKPAAEAAPAPARKGAGKS
ncbi:MAG: efflux RND transporter periplasmic adaptor subunit [Planctomycetota bacterium]|nr:efflux RND transporter periplasmic adaptor subunit [Planctomycetota bacterium]